MGVAYCELVGRQLGVAEFVDDDQLCGLEAVVVQLGAREAVTCKVCVCAIVVTFYSHLIVLEPCTLFHAPCMCS